MTKNFKGGYKIVSLNGNDLTSESAFTIKGLYEDLRDSYSKPILVTEIVIDDEKQQDAYAVVKKTESGYTIDVYDYALTVTDEDAVTSEAIVKGITSIDGYEGEVTLGEGLALTEEGELSASGGGSTLYQHNMFVDAIVSSVHYKFVFAYINEVSTKYVASDFDSLVTEMTNRGTNLYNNGNPHYVANGSFNNGIVIGANVTDGASFRIFTYDLTDKQFSEKVIVSSGITVFEDAIIKLGA